MEEPIIEIKYGKLKGKVGTDYKGRKYHSFQGVPYGKAPIGELRFKSPLPPEKWEGIRDATKVGNSSYSQEWLDRSIIIGSEDCLHLNIYTPNIPEANERIKLNPVMLYIHGGGFHYGNGDPDFLGPDHLVAGDVVLITINYRLGMLGIFDIFEAGGHRIVKKKAHKYEREIMWWRTSFLSLEDPSLGVPGNAGLKDMVQSLKWVKENIEHFGGDPNNVTIFGESAGGSSVHLLMCSPMAKGLFHRAILQSGSAFNPWVWSTFPSKTLCKHLNIPNEKELLEYLRKVPCRKFIDIQTEIKEAVLYTSSCDEIRNFSVVVEKPSPTEPNFITQHPMEIMASGNYNKVPVMIGYASREGLLTEVMHNWDFGALQVPTDLSTRIPHLYNIPKGSEISTNLIEKMKKFYYGDEDNSEEGFLNLETDVLFFRGVYLAVRELSKTLNLPIYYYRFTARTQLNVVRKLGKIRDSRSGTAHCDMLGYLFSTDHTPKFEPNTIENKMVDRIITMWTNFARTGNPNSKKLEVTWTPVQKDCFNYLDIGNDLKPGKNPDEDRMNFWNEVAKDPKINSKF